MKIFWHKMKFSVRYIVDFIFSNKMIFVVASTVIILDQVSKFLARKFLILHEPFNVIGEFFRLTLIFNRGITFGLLNDSKIANIQIILVIVTIFVIIFLFWFYIYLLKMLHYKVLSFFNLGFALILGGAFGNLADRIVFGKVTDFLDFGIGDWRFYTFNIADSCVTIGTVILVFSVLVSDILMKREKTV